MTHSLADNMYDHDQIQGQNHGRQVQDELNQIQPSTPEEEINLILRHLVISIAPTKNSKEENRLIDEAKEYLSALLVRSRLETEREILEFATRVQANGSFVPIEVGLIPWMRDRAAQQEGEAHAAAN